MFGSRAGNVASVGRVQTPTLAIVYARELEIRNFKPRDYWRVTAKFEIAKGQYEGIYQRPDFKKAEATSTTGSIAFGSRPRRRRWWPPARGSRSPTSPRKRKPAPRSRRAFTISPRCSAKRTTASVSRRKRTLQIAQALYERHKMMTYPRTDSRALPEDYICRPSRQTLGNLAGDLESARAKRPCANGWVRPNKRIFNNAQICDHFAIIPTTSEAKNLDETEAKIYDMIARRFVAVVLSRRRNSISRRASAQIARAQIQDRGQGPDRARLARSLRADDGRRRFAGRQRRCRR